jgi:protein kinase A
MSSAKKAFKAIQKGNLDTLKQLVAKNPDVLRETVKIKIHDGVQEMDLEAKAIHFASASGSAIILNYLLNDCKVNANETAVSNLNSKVYPLAIAEGRGEQAIIDILVKAGGTTGHSSENKGSRKKQKSPDGPKNVKGDLEVRDFRIKTSEFPYLKPYRDHFNSQLAKLSAGQASAMTLEDVKSERTLGTGSFGRVLFVRHKKKAGDYFALKCLKKQQVIKMKQVEHTINEKNLLFSMNFNGVVRLFDFFQDKKVIYLALEFVNGGEMFTHIQKLKARHFNFEQTRFYSAETCMAFEYMHSLDIAYRDLKPENLLITDKGHLKVTDFGFAKRVADRTYTMCGTPEYLAPEIIKQQGYNHAVDWWAVGVLTFEMRCGRAPFEAASQTAMYKKILAADFQFPRGFKPEEESFIKALLQVDVTKRLGSVHGWTKKIMDHPYFKGYNWDALRNHTHPSPFKPKVSGPDDCSNFDQYPEEPIKWHGSKLDADDVFLNF